MSMVMLCKVKHCMHHEGGHMGAHQDQVRGWVAVAHLFNHQTHHRGQVTTLLDQLGIDPGVTDYLAYVS